MEKRTGSVISLAKWKESRQTRGSGDQFLPKEPGVMRVTPQSLEPMLFPPGALPTMRARGVMALVREALEEGSTVTINIPHTRIVFMREIPKSEDE
ncbi:MAG: hypothetical protein AAB553_06300 [Patescibacteria group bacterium]